MEYGAFISLTRALELGDQDNLPPLLDKPLNFQCHTLGGKKCKCRFAVRMVIVRSL